MMKQNTDKPRWIAERMYKIARAHLLGMILLTVLSTVLMVCGISGEWMFFPAIPLFSVLMGAVIDNVFLGACVAGVVMLFYVLCWIMSKKHYGWMIAALAMFILDMIAEMSLSLMGGAVSGVIHIWVLAVLVIGVFYGVKLKELPEE